MIYLHWVRNTLRNYFRATQLGKLARSLFTKSKVETICFVAATRQSEEDFWKNSPLGIGLKPLLGDPTITISIAFENKNGLPFIYNNAIKAEQEADILVFLHDDIWLDDENLIEKIRFSLQRFDIVGLAGNTRIQKNQPTWAHCPIQNNQFIWDQGFLSGTVRHGSLDLNEPTVFGPSPAHCELMDGVLLAGKRNIMVESNVGFDERFKFHFYDLDFCRSARRAGLSLGTWPIDIIHQSGGAFGSPTWWDGHAAYMRKWEC